jgi:hypothetical protein
MRIKGAIKLMITTLFEMQSNPKSGVNKEKLDYPLPALFGCFTKTKV